jgi:hypothetical protein
MDVDPWQMRNLYAKANATYRASLHEEVHKWLACKEGSCP